MRLSGGTELAYVTAGDPSNPALLLLHGFPSSSRTFRDVIPGLARVAYVIAPDLPGHGQSDVPPAPSFAEISEAISELLAHLVIGRRFIYVHDWAPLWACRSPCKRPSCFRASSSRTQTHIVPASGPSGTPH
ncbi:alpha/beta fold hydrolase [Mesorhizobium sp. f-mel]